VEVDDPGNDPDKLRVDATRSFIDELNSSLGDRAGAVRFSSNAEVIEWMDDDLADVRAGVNDGTIYANGGTRMERGIDRAREAYPASGSNDRVMVLLSDGINDRPAEDVIEAAERAADEDIAIYTVGLSDEADEPLLTQVANMTGGEYYKAEDASELEEVFDQIAGNVTEGRDLRRIERENVESAVRINGSPQVIASDVNLNDPSAGPISESLSFENGSLLSFAATSYDCSDPQPVDTVNNSTGTTFNETECSSGAAMNSADNSSVTDHIIRLNNDTVPGEYTAAQLPWYHAGIGSVVPDQYIDGGTFNLSEQQAVFVLELSSGDNDYAVALFEANDTPTPGGGGCPDGLPNATLGFTPGGTVTNGTTVGIDGAANDTDPCASASAITAQTITVRDSVGSTVLTTSGNSTSTTLPSPGTYTVAYAAEDDEGNTVVVTRALNVTTPTGGGGGPCVDGSPDNWVTAPSTVETGEEVTIDPGASDTDACGPGIVNHSLWGPGVSSNTSSAVTASWSTTGNKTIHYRVYDDEGNPSYTEVEIEVISGGGGGSGSDEPDNGFVIGIGGDEVVVDDDDDD